MSILDGKIAIVTGAGQGVGRGEALALAKEGASVVVVDVNEQSGTETVSILTAFGAKAIFVKCDVTDRSQVDIAVARAISAFGTVDILVNNAMLIPNPTRVEEYSEDIARACFNVGPLGTLFFMQACFPIMKAAGRGKIINTVSASGHGISAPGFSVYGAAKEAIRALTRSSAREWGVYGINVNAVSPSSLSPAAATIYPTEDEQNALLRNAGAAIAKWSHPEKDVGRTVVFLAGPDSNQITGCVISVDGGLAMI